MTLAAELETHLRRELGDAATARALAAILLEETLSWRAPVIAPERMTTVLAFTFGNRMLPNGNREPGPVNQVIADVVAALHQRTGARVFAQWEVAAALAGRVPDDDDNRDQSRPRCTRRACVSRHRPACWKKSRAWPNRSRSAASAWWRSPTTFTAASRRLDGSASMPTRRTASRCRDTYDPEFRTAMVSRPHCLPAARHHDPHH